MSSVNPPSSSSPKRRDEEIVAPRSSPPTSTAGDLFGISVREEQPLPHPLPSSLSNLLAGHSANSLQAHTIVDTTSTHREELEKLLQTLEETLNNNLQAARFVFGDDGELSPREAIHRTIIRPDQGRGTMAALRARISALGF